MTSYTSIEAAAHRGAHGHNKRAEPTIAQAEAGNYLKGRATVHGMRLVIENPRGSVRRWRDADGNEGETQMRFHYGYFAGVKGADGDELDCYVGPVPEVRMAYVVNQYLGGAFDEHKVMLGFPNQRAAEAGYLSCYSAGWQGMQSCIPASIDQLKWWMANGDKTRPLSADQLPYEQRNDMEKVLWNGVEPKGTDLARVLYGVRAHDAQELLLFDSVSMADILSAAESLTLYDAMMVPFQRLEPAMTVLQNVLNRTAGDLKVTAMQVSPPFKQAGTTNVAVVYELSDGQTLAIYFHNPDTTPQKITPADDLISWKWMLNKKDVTIVVAPERGRDLNVRQVATRIMALASKNSARFVSANAKRAERMHTIQTSRDALAEAQAELESLENEIAVVTEAGHTQYAALLRSSSELQDAYLRAKAADGTDPKTGRTADDLSADVDAGAARIKILAAVLNGEDVPVAPAPVVQPEPQADPEPVASEPPAPTADDLHAQWLARMEENSVAVVSIDGAAWFVVGTGAKGEVGGDHEGQVLAHLASKTAGSAQANGWNPAQMNDWIADPDYVAPQAEPEPIAPVTEPPLPEGIVVPQPEPVVEPSPPAASAKPDLTYRAVDDMFTAFYANTPAGEEAWKVIAADTEGTGKVFTQHVDGVIAQLRESGYTVAPQQEDTSDVDDLVAQLQERDAPASGQPVLEAAGFAHAQDNIWNRSVANENGDKLWLTVTVSGTGAGYGVTTGVVTGTNTGPVEDLGQFDTAEAAVAAAQVAADSFVAPAAAPMPELKEDVKGYPYAVTTDPTVLYRSVSPAELEAILASGKIAGGLNKFNGFDPRREVFFSDQLNAQTIHQGEDISRRVDYAILSHPIQQQYEQALDAAAARRAEVKEQYGELRPPAGVLAELRALDQRGTDLQTEARGIVKDMLAQEHETNALRDYTSAVLQTKPLAGARQYSSRWGNSGMGKDDEYGFDSDAVTLADIDLVHLVKEGEVVKTVTVQELLAERASAAPPAEPVAPESVAPESQAAAAEPEADPLADARARIEGSDFNRYTKDFLHSLSVIKGVDEGVERGWDRSLFVSSITGKMKTLAKSDAQLAGILLAWLATAQSKFAKPALAPRNAVWKLVGDWEQYLPLFGQPEEADAAEPDANAAPQIPEENSYLQRMVTENPQLFEEAADAGLSPMDKGAFMAAINAGEQQGFTVPQLEADLAEAEQQLAGVKVGTVSPRSVVGKGGKKPEAVSYLQGRIESLKLALSDGGYLYTVNASNYNYYLRALLRGAAQASATPAPVEPEAAPEAPPTSAPPAEPEAPPQNDERDAAMRLLRAVIDGTANMADPGLAGELQAMHAAYKDDAEFAELFKQAVKAYSAYAVSRANEAMASAA